MERRGWRGFKALRVAMRRIGLEGRLSKSNSMVCGADGHSGVLGLKERSARMSEA